jgi:hypothetical protein
MAMMSIERESNDNAASASDGIEATGARRIYLLRGECVRYENIDTWIVRAFVNKQKAVAMAAQGNARVGELESWRDGGGRDLWSCWKELRATFTLIPFDSWVDDPSMLDALQYTVTAVELDESEPE